MKKYIASLACLVLALFWMAPAMAILPPYEFPIVNKIFFEISKEQWVSTKEARVVVSVDATLNDGHLEKAKNRIMAQLDKISNQAEWRIIEFQQTQDASKLEKLGIQAEARLPEAALSNLRDNAKKISKPGETYQVVGIDFTPSHDELEQIKKSLRSEIYNEVQEELKRLHQVFPNQKFSTYEINISVVGLPIQAAPKALAFFGGTDTATSEAREGLSVSNKITMYATVIFGSLMEKEVKQ